MTLPGRVHCVFVLSCMIRVPFSQGGAPLRPLGEQSAGWRTPLRSTERSGDHAKQHSACPPVRARRRALAPTPSGPGCRVPARDAPRLYAIAQSLRKSCRRVGICHRQHNCSVCVGSRHGGIVAGQGIRRSNPPGTISQGRSACAFPRDRKPCSVRPRAGRFVRRRVGRYIVCPHARSSGAARSPRGSQAPPRASRVEAEISHPPPNGSHPGSTVLGAARRRFEDFRMVG
jgi:hypothetical protein